MPRSHMTQLVQRVIWALRYFLKLLRKFQHATKFGNHCPGALRLLVQPFSCLDQNKRGQAKMLGKTTITTLVIRKQRPCDASESSPFHLSPPSVSVLRILLDRDKIKFIVFTNGEDTVDFIYSFNIVFNVESRLQQTLMAGYVCGACN